MVGRALPCQLGRAYLDPSFLGRVVKWKEGCLELEGSG
jgi:hypothetical protein